jgi:hypothetical protein
MRSILAILFAGFLSVAPAWSSEKDDVTVTLHKFVDGWNKGGMKAVTGNFTDSPAILDTIPPYHWQGAKALMNYDEDYAIYVRSHDITDGAGEMSEPTTIELSGEYAYAVVPAVFHFKKRGQPAESHGIMTFSLRKVHQDWRISAFTWANQ